MGRVILTLRDRVGSTTLVSLKCKSKVRAAEIAAKRPNCAYFDFYENGERIPTRKKVLSKTKSITEMVMSGEINMDNIEEYIP